MNASKVIQDLAALPPAEQAEVIRFAYRLDAERQLRPAPSFPRSPSVTWFRHKEINTKDRASAWVDAC
jgi:hypothetical protein